MIVTVTLNPAMDVCNFFDDTFVVDKVNRISRSYRAVGGKGIHISKNLATLGMKSRAIGIAMGIVGKEVIGYMSEPEIEVDFAYFSDIETRTNYIMLDGNTSTLITNRGAPPPMATIEEFLAIYEKQVRAGDVVAISGDAANFAGMDLQKRFCEIAAARGARMVLDSSVAYLAEGIKFSPYIIKPNTQELAELTNMPTDTDEQIIAAVRTLDEYNIEIIAVSRGEDGCLVKFGDRFYKADPAKINLVNAIGCGDAFLAGFLYALEAGKTPEECVAAANSAGGAEAEEELTCKFSVDRYNEILSGMNVVEIIQKP